MREIKFRTWNPTGKEMNYVAKVSYLGGTGFYDQSLDNENNIWMQYTGLKDRQGNEIFEGDVVEFLDGSRYEVSYQDIVASFMLTQRKKGQTHSTGFDMIDAHESVVIGNIFANPELLEVKA